MKLISIFISTVFGAAVQRDIGTGCWLGCLQELGQDFMKCEGLENASQEQMKCQWDAAGVFMRCFFACLPEDQTWRTPTEDLTNIYTV